MFRCPTVRSFSRNWNCVGWEKKATKAGKALGGWRAKTWNVRWENRRCWGSIPIKKFIKKISAFPFRFDSILKTIFHHLDITSYLDQPNTYVFCYYEHTCAADNDQPTQQRALPLTRKKSNNKNKTAKTESFCEARAKKKNIEPKKTALEVNG